VFDKIIFKKTPTLADFSAWDGAFDGFFAQAPSGVMLRSVAASMRVSARITLPVVGINDGGLGFVYR